MAQSKKISEKSIKSDTNKSKSKKSPKNEVSLTKKVWNMADVLAACGESFIRAEFLIPFQTNALRRHLVFTANMMEIKMMTTLLQLAQKFHQQKIFQKVALRLHFLPASTQSFL